MDMKTSNDLECSICFNLLTENPEKDPFPGPSLPKRPRPNDLYIPQLPQPSTSSAGAYFSQTSPQTNPNVIPELCATPCGHIFHRCCIFNWVNIKKECPICRKKVIPAFQYESETFKLTKVFLPLAPGHCQNCYEYAKQLEIIQVKYTVQKSLVDCCKQKEQELECTCNALIQRTEELGGALRVEAGKVQNLQAQMKFVEEKSGQLERQLILERRNVEELQDQVEGKEVEKVMEKHYLIQDYENDISQLHKELRGKERRILELEESEKSFKERCERLAKEKKDFELKMAEILKQPK